MNDSYSLVFLNGAEDYNSIQGWATHGQEETRHTCTIFSQPIFIKYVFENMPPLIVFEFSNQAIHINLFINIQLENGQHHFTAQIILSDGQVWFYYGIDTGRNLIYNGSVNSNPPSISHCRGKQAIAAIYVTV